VFKKCIVLVLSLILLTASFVCPAFGASNQVTVSIPAFHVRLNELLYANNDHERYPLLVQQIN